MLKTFVGNRVSTIQHLQNSGIIFPRLRTRLTSFPEISTHQACTTVHYGGLDLPSCPLRTCLSVSHHQFLNNCRANFPKNFGILKAVELKESEMKLLKIVQEEDFHKEIKSLKVSGFVITDSQLMPGTRPGFLNPLGDVGLLLAKYIRHPDSNTLHLNFFKLLGEKYHQFRNETMFCLWVAYVPFVMIIKADAAKQLDKIFEINLSPFYCVLETIFGVSVNALHNENSQYAKAGVRLGDIFMSRESNRIYSVVPIFGRQVYEDTEICGYTVPKGSSCMVLNYYLHRDETIFPDPEKFDPDRFLPENAADIPEYGFLPFSAGPRNCIGKVFAMQEMKTILSYILRRFVLQSLDGREKVKPVIHVVLNNSIPVRIRFRNRSNDN
ncbi:Cytochrome P450 4V2 like protein [Argiope bruennichi]|uniref:Cytochrome P450 4V2 like protein n=1 Tax=Argiope bruennichi TaxID=94029 RepID=A0A8T0G2S2_ARGBR|nr:Cytochrome P450 4V2 like protein [Argiope bruennichi]